MSIDEPPIDREASMEEAMQVYHEMKPSFPSAGVVPGRATTNEEKNAIIERLYELWCASPQLRLGQLLLNCLGSDFYYVEDETLIERLESYYETVEVLADPEQVQAIQQSEQEVGRPWGEAKQK